MSFRARILIGLGLIVLLPLAVFELRVRADMAGRLARVEGLKQDPAIGPVDLTDVARSFVQEIEGWRSPKTTP